MQINPTIPPSTNPDEKPSKTKQKKVMHALQKLGEDLVELNDKQLTALDLPEQLHDAINQMKQISKFGARQRQLQYIGKIMRKIDVSSIQEKLNAWKQVSVHQTAQLHRIERWRERLLTDSIAITEFADKYPTTDIKHIHLLIRNTLKERKSGSSTKNYRLLFQAIQKTLLTSNSDT